MSPQYYTQGAQRIINHTLFIKKGDVHPPMHGIFKVKAIYYIELARNTRRPTFEDISNAGMSQSRYLDCMTVPRMFTI